MEKSTETTIIEAQQKEIADLRDLLDCERQEKYAHLRNCEAIIAFNDNLRAALKAAPNWSAFFQLSPEALRAAYRNWDTDLRTPALAGTAAHAQDAENDRLKQAYAHLWKTHADMRELTLNEVVNGLPSDIYKAERK